MDKDAVKLAFGFGGGKAIGDKCGTLTASIMVLGRMLTAEILDDIINHEINKG